MDKACDNKIEESCTHLTELFDKNSTFYADGKKNYPNLLTKYTK